MNIVACRDREQSLNSMWRAYLAMTLLTDTEKAEKSAAIVGHAFLNARYYDSQRGQFLSQDPVFWEVGQTQDGNTAMTNPQAMNAYGYGNGNPITNKDPNGRCGDPISGAVCLFAAALLMPQVAGDPVFNSDGSVSSTPGQSRMEAALFVAGFASPSGAGGKIVGATERITPQIAGKAGEMASGLVNGAKESFVVNEVRRIPDQVDRNLGRVIEVKNTAYQAFTKQLKDDIAISNQLGFQNSPLLVFRDSTRLSQPLQEAIKSGQFTGMSLIRDVLSAALKTLTKGK